jgi:hypothetical protein
MKIKRFGVLSMGLNFGIYLALFGLVAGLLIALGSMLGGGLMGEGGGMMAGMGLLAVIIIPILYAIIGFIGGLLAALFMNVAFSITGGLEIDLQQ